ncbi:MAG TPA: AraC family transcriptional regulator [Terriglobales bacterium]|nr:AraC family transcriptional regulator [Terriglobales bacterium]
MEPKLDWLSRLLAMVPVSGRLDHRCFLSAPWRIEYQPSPPGEIPFHIVLGGAVIFEETKGPAAKSTRSQLRPGDIVLVIHGAAHALHDGSGASPLPQRDRPTLNLTISENDGTGDRIDMLCGCFHVSPAHEKMLRRYLPPRLVIAAPENSPATAKEGTSSQLAALIALMKIESASENLGSAAMLDALSTALFALILRQASEVGAASEGLLALAGNPKLAPALTAMFNEPAHPWTLPELARLCNMSRATFIRHFQERLGRSAADLLMEIRMTVAANALRDTDNSTGAIAELAGYQSEAAFQRSFKQYMGFTPAQWRKQAEELSDEDTD